MGEILQIKELWVSPKRTQGRDYSAIDSRRRPSGLHIFSDLAVSPASSMEEHLSWAADYICDGIDRIHAFLSQHGNSGVVSIVCVSKGQRITYAIEPEILAAFERAGLTLEFGFEYDGPLTATDQDEA